jgi:hypothetical protein
LFAQNKNKIISEEVVAWTKIHASSVNLKITALMTAPVSIVFIMPNTANNARRKSVVAQRRKQRLSYER